MWGVAPEGSLMPGQVSKIVQRARCVEHDRPLSDQSARVHGVTDRPNLLVGGGP